MSRNGTAPGEIPAVDALPPPAPPSTAPSARHRAGTPSDPRTPAPTPRRIPPAFAVLTNAAPSTTTNALEESTHLPQRRRSRNAPRCIDDLLRRVKAPRGTGPEGVRRMADLLRPGANGASAIT